MNKQEKCKKQLNTWVQAQINAGVYSNSGDACGKISKDTLGLGSGKTFEHYLYGIRFPVGAKHVMKLSRLTGIKPEVLNPESF